jgi:hypothetical protein
MTQRKQFQNLAKEMVSANKQYELCVLNDDHEVIYREWTDWKGGTHEEISCQKCTVILDDVYTPHKE